MVAALLQCVLLLAAIVVDAASCESGWFGENCRFECHCTDFRLCESNGECSNGKCIWPYFGPACQFFDIVIKYSTSRTPYYIKDNNDKTCNPDKSATLAFLEVSSQSQILWFRIHVNDQSNVDNFTVSINGNTSCVNGRKFKYNSYMDVMCDTDAVLRRLYINGPIAANICSVYISMGQNFAIRQEVSQSSTFNNNISNVASKAVDGLKYPRKEYACTQTDIEHAPQWRLDFNQQYKISLIFVMPAEMKGFILQGFNDDNETTYFYQDTSSIEQNQYLLWIPLTALIRRIEVSLPESGHERKLQICEVETFGENVCPEGTYGMWCSEKCQCDNRSLCHHISGLCSKPCAIGFYGLNCESECENCMDGICHQATGHCTHCNPGFEGELCNSYCAYGKWGQRCSEECPLNCADGCNHTDGSCTCKDNFAGLLCSDCASGYYGENCTKVCPKFCKGRICDRQSGECLLCLGERVGIHCDKCVEKTYGINCDLRCSQFCQNQTCDHLTGRCRKCIGGFSGDDCLLVGVKPAAWVAPVTAIPFLLLIFFCIPNCPVKDSDSLGSQLSDLDESDDLKIPSSRISEDIAE